MRKTDIGSSLKVEGLKLLLSLILIVASALGVMFAAVADTSITDYIVFDGNTTTHIRSATQMIDTMLDENGINMINARYTVEDRGDYTAVTISRKPVVTIVSGEVELTAVVNNGTVGDTLERLGYEITENKLVTPSSDIWVYDGMKISVEDITYEYDTEEIVTPYETEYVDTEEEFLGTMSVITEGVPGKSEITYETMYVDGEFYRRSPCDISVVEEPENEVVARGTKEITYPENPEVIVDPENMTLTTSEGEVLEYSKVITMTATAYTYNSGANITSSGVPVQVGIVAALPSTLPQGTRVYIVSPYGNWEYGISVVGDKPGSDILDLFMETREECIEFGVRDALVYVIEE